MAAIKGRKDLPVYGLQFWLRFHLKVRRRASSCAMRTLLCPGILGKWEHRVFGASLETLPGR